MGRHGLLLIVLAGAGCFSAGAKNCTPGTQQACACAGGADGVQVCKDDGSGFAGCTRCSSGGDMGADDLSMESADLSTPPADMAIQCVAPKANCDGDPMSGCNVNLDTDAKNCGKCGMVCGQNAPVCVGGTCRGKCALGFAPHVDYAVGMRPYAIRMADLNGDGKPDLATINSSSNNISVLLNAGNGTFPAPVNYPAGNNSGVWLDVGDVNGDGKRDLVAGAGAIFAFLNNGDGTFPAPIQTQVGNQVVNVALGDLDGDGKLDVATYTNPNNVAVVFNTGNGTFGAATNYPLGKTANGITAGDLNGDGKPDLAIPEGNSNNVRLLWNDGKGGFANGTDVAVGTPGFVAIGDLNGDGKPDLAVAIISNPGVSVLLNNGNGTFAPEVLYRTNAASPLSVAVGDLDSDGKPDLVLPNMSAKSVSVFTNSGNGTFAAPMTIAIGGSAAPAYAAVGDLNGDGKPDLAICDAGAMNVSILLNQCM